MAKMVKKVVWQDNSGVEWGSREKAIESDYRGAMLVALGIQPRSYKESGVFYPEDIFDYLLRIEPDRRRAVVEVLFDFLDELEGR